MFETEPLGFDVMTCILFYSYLAYILCFRSSFFSFFFFSFKTFFSFFFRFTFVALSGGRGHTFWIHIDE